MKKLIFLLIALPAFASAQYDSTKVLQDIQAYGYKWKNGKFSGSFIVPTDTFKLAVKDSGALAYKSGEYYKYNGYIWQLVGGGGSDDLQTVTDVGNTTSNSMLLGTGNMLELNSDGRIGSNQIDVYSGSNYPSATGINSIMSSATGNWVNNLPNADGILAVSVNGNTADVSGNITVSVPVSVTLDSTIIATGGQTAFDFTSVPTDYADYFVFVNGAEIENTTYFTTSGNTVTFTSPLLVGDRVRYKRIK